MPSTQRLPLRNLEGFKTVKAATKRHYLNATEVKKAKT